MEDVQRLKEIAYQSFGEVAVLMNNAGIGNGGGPFEHYERWQRVLAVNLWGVINGVQAFAPAMAAQGTPARSSTPARSRASPRRPATPPTMSARPA